MLMNQVLGEVFKLTDSIITALSEQQQQPLKFEAVLPITSMGIPSGAKVPVVLELFGSKTGSSTIRLGASQFAVQLRIGPHCAAPQQP
jgi:hypothetical protein